MSDLRLSIHLVPAVLWGFNLRKLIPKSRWTKLRAQIIAERGLRCETCGVEVHESAQINAHEVWTYDESQSTAVARLDGIELTCKSCHSCEHWGRLTNLVEQGVVGPDEMDRLIAHFCKVNGVKKSAFEHHRKAAFADFKRRSALQWRVEWGSFTALVQEYNRDIPSVGR